MALAPDHAHRVHVEQQAGLTSFGRCFRVENVRLAEAQVEALKASGILVQQETKVRGRLMCRCDGEQHASVQPARNSRAQAITDLLKGCCTFPEVSASCGPAHEALHEPADFWA